MDDLSAPRPLSRILRTLELIQDRPGITAAEIAHRLGVSDRAVRRYVGTLREAAIPVASLPGRHGGYRLGRGASLPPVHFTATEALGLVMAALDGHHHPADPDDPVGAALGKVIRAMPPGVGRQADSLRRHAQAAPDRRAARPDSAVTAALVDAIAAGHIVRLDYTSGAGEARDLDVAPWSLVVRHGRWYLLGAEDTVPTGRAYRVDRIARVVTTNRACVRPAGLDPVAWLEEHLRTGWRFDAQVVFDAPPVDVAPFVPTPMGRLEPVDSGSRTLVTGRTSNPTMYAGEWLAAVPFAFVVLGGPELRNAVHTLAGRLAAAVAR